MRMHAPFLVASEASECRKACVHSVLCRQNIRNWRRLLQVCTPGVLGVFLRIVIKLAALPADVVSVFTCADAVAFVAPDAIAVMQGRAGMSHVCPGLGAFESESA